MCRAWPAFCIRSTSEGLECLMFRRKMHVYIVCFRHNSWARAVRISDEVSLCYTFTFMKWMEGNFTQNPEPGHAKEALHIA